MATRPIFMDRNHAGKKLAQKLFHYREMSPLVMAIPRGGVPVAFEVAKALHAPLDLIVARKIGSPFDPEFAVGAIAPGDVIILSDSLGPEGLDRENLDRLIGKEMTEMERRMAAYKSGEWSEGHASDLIIIIDDGLATGMTAKAAIESAIVINKPHKIVFAAPICSLDAIKSLANIVDVVSVYDTDELDSIGSWYEKFDQMNDKEVLDYLQKAKDLMQR